MDRMSLAEARVPRLGHTVPPTRYPTAPEHNQHRRLRSGKRAEPQEAGAGSRVRPFLLLWDVWRSLGRPWVQLEASSVTVPFPSPRQRRHAAASLLSHLLFFS